MPTGASQPYFVPSANRSATVQVRQAAEGWVAWIKSGFVDELSILQACPTYVKRRLQLWVGDAAA